MRKGMWKKGLTVAMAAAMLAGPVSVPAVFNNGVSVVKADETNKGQDVYVLMNIPYADFYKALGTFLFRQLSYKLCAKIQTPINNTSFRRIIKISLPFNFLPEPR